VYSTGRNLWEKTDLPVGGGERLFYEKVEKLLKRDNLHKKRQKNAYLGWAALLDLHRLLLAGLTTGYYVQAPNSGRKRETPTGEGRISLKLLRKRTSTP